MAHRGMEWLVSGGTVAFALGLYFVSAPTGLAMFALAAALAGGVVGAVVSHCLGWRTGTAAALVWVMSPGVWDRVVTGSAGLLAVCGAIGAGGLGYAGFMFMTRRARALRREPPPGDDVVAAHGFVMRRDRGGRIVTWSLLAAAVAWGVHSAVTHDRWLGKVASAYARIMLDEAGDRFVVLNGVADEQMIFEEAKRMRAEGRAERGSRLLQFREDASYRTQLVSLVRREWPAEVDLRAAAQIGPAALAAEISRCHPERVYVMTGWSTTPEKWAARWAAMTPCLASRDRFVPRMRQAFAYEGNVLANRLQREGETEAAWALYSRVYDEIDPGNAFALINLDGMLRRGHVADRKQCERIEGEMRNLARERRLPAARPDWRMLAAWNNEMIRAHGRGDLGAAAYIARKILSQPGWRSFIPANAVMGSVLAHEGAYEEAEPFFKAALSGKGEAAAQPAVMNDYADVLRKLKRHDEAEAMARRAICAKDTSEMRRIHGDGAYNVRPCTKR